MGDWRSRPSAAENWTCPNPAHRSVTMVNDLAACNACGITSAMTGRFTERTGLAQAAAITAGLEDYIEQRAGQMAAGRVEALNRAVTAQVATANANAEHWRKLVAEVGRDLDRASRQVDEFAVLRGSCIALMADWSRRATGLMIRGRRRDRPAHDAIERCEWELRRAVFLATRSAGGGTDG